MVSSIYCRSWNVFPEDKGGDYCISSALKWIYNPVKSLNFFLPQFTYLKNEDNLIDFVICKLLYRDEILLIV